MTVKIGGTEKELIVDMGSPVTIIPPDKEVIKAQKILPITRRYQDLNKNEVKFTGQITVEAEGRGIRKNLPMLITEGEDIKPLIGMDWLREFNWTTGNIESTRTLNNQSEKDKIITKFEKRLKTNPTIKDAEIKI